MTSKDDPGAISGCVLLRQELIVAVCRRFSISAYHVRMPLPMQASQHVHIAGQNTVGVIPPTVKV
jgi:hypothetical protein